MAPPAALGSFPVPLRPQTPRVASALARAPEVLPRPPTPGLAPPGKRGSAAEARRIASDSALLAEATATLVDRYYAKGTLRVKASKLSLAEDLATRAGFTQIFPLTEEVLDAVAAALLMAGYTSGFGYITELRLKHQELDFPLGPALLRKLAHIEDALNRGQGPPSRAPEVRPSEIPRSPFDSETNEMVGATRSFITASAWILREVEMSDLDASPRNIELVSSTAVALKLPMTKTDQRGIGAVRTLECHCKLGRYDDAPADRSCGPCAVRTQLRALETQFGVVFGTESGNNFPLFPLLDGSRPSKARVIDSWGIALGCPVKGHSGRRSGAKMRARVGWAVWMVQFFGRWAGASVLEYIEEALAQRTQGWSTPSDPGMATPSAAGPPPTLLAIADGPASNATEIASLSERVAKAEEAIASRSESLEAKLVEVSAAIPVARDPLCVVTSGKYHLLPQGSLELPRPFWTAVCGWRFGVSLAGELSFMSEAKAAASGRGLCDRCSKRRAFGM